MATKKKKDLPERATPEQIGELKEKLMTTPITEEAAYAITEVLQEALPENKRSEALRVSLPLKEIILFYLWGYSTQTKDNGVKAQILEAHDVLKEGLVGIRLKDIEEAKRGNFHFSLSRRPGYSEELLDQHIKTSWVALAIAQFYGFEKEYREANKQRDKPQHIKTGIHLAKQFLGPVSPQTKLNFAETLDRYGQETSLTKGNRPLGWGLDLNVAQQRVTYAILGAFSPDEYQGQLRLPVEEVLSDPERGPHILPGKWKEMGPKGMARQAYKDIPHLPTIRLTLAEVVKLAGYDHSRQGDKEKVKQAVAQLGTDRYLFYWKRKAFKIVDGVLIRDRDGKGEHKWEEVIEDGSLFRVKHVLDEQTKELKYFEISPSAVALDQVNPAYGGNYFLMVPKDLHIEIQKAVGKGKRSSSYTFAFLMYLLTDYERIRRHAKKGTIPEHSIRKPWEEIAQRIKIPENFWKRNPQKAVERLDRVYQVAKELGWLRSYSRGQDGTDTLELEPSKYYRPEEDQEQLLGEGEKEAEA